MSIFANCVTSWFNSSSAVNQDCPVFKEKWERNNIAIKPIPPPTHTLNPEHGNDTLLSSTIFILIQVFLIASGSLARKTK